MKAKLLLTKGSSHMGCAGLAVMVVGSWAGRVLGFLSRMLLQPMPRSAAPTGDQVLLADDPKSECRPEPMNSYRLVCKGGPNHR